MVSLTLGGQGWRKVLREGIKKLFDILKPEGVFILGIDTEMSGDKVVEYEGYKVLVVGIEYFKILDGKTVDCQDTRNGIALLVR